MEEFLRGTLGTFFFDVKVDVALATLLRSAGFWGFFLFSQKRLELTCFGCLPETAGLFCYAYNPGRA